MKIGAGLAVRGNIKYSFYTGFLYDMLHIERIAGYEVCL